MNINARIEDGENSEDVTIAITDLDAFIHAAGTEEVFVTDAEGNQATVRKKHLSRFRVLPD